MKPFAEMFGNDGVVDRMARHAPLIGYAQLCSGTHG